MGQPYIEFNSLIGKVFTKIEGLQKGSDEVRFFVSDGTVVKMLHEQNCCENVRVEDVCGNVDDLINESICVAAEVSQDDPNADDSATWTFYKLATKKGWVDIRWYGSSNGYYSEEVSCVIESNS